MRRDAHLPFCRAGHKVPNLPGDSTLLLEFNLRIHGERKNVPTCILCYGEVSVPIAEPLVRFLKMQRYWIVNSGPNTNGGKTHLKLVSPLGTYDIQVVDSSCPRRFVWNLNRIVRGPE